MSDELRIAHCYDPSTRAYMCVVHLQESPDGTWPLPEHTVETTPTQMPGRHQTLRLADDGTAWELVCDFRNCPLWDTSTGLRVPNSMQLAEPLPANVTHLAPPILDSLMPASAVWSADRSEWELVPDYSGRPLWNKGDGTTADPLPRGRALTATVTDRSPPTPRPAEIMFNDALDAWVDADRTTVASL